MKSKRIQLMKLIIKELKGQGIEFGKDPHALSLDHARELAEWAGAAQYRGRKESSMGLGRQFYQYLSLTDEVG